MSQPPGDQANHQARSRSVSQVGSTTAHGGFAQRVGWDTKIRPLNDAEYDNLPKIQELRKLVQQSFIVPAWLASPESPQYDLYRVHTDQFRLDAEQLADGVSDPVYTQDKVDKLLSTDVAGCLPNLLQIVRQVDALQASMLELEPVEADRRHPIDTLGSLIWDIQSGGFIYRLGRKLQIPGPPGTWTRPDSCAFIQLPTNYKLLARPDMHRALSCFHKTRSAPNCRHILHWVTEFKRADDKEASKHQVVKGLVSALYQRRALGFPNHFIFGTAHYSGTSLEVLAATWVPSEPVDPEADSVQEVVSRSTASLVDQENDPAASLSPGDDTLGGTSGAGPRPAGAGDNLTAKDIKKYNKIVVYSTATYSMIHLEHLLQLYLLMRQTRFSADEYKKEIMKHSNALIKELSKEAPDIYRWPPPPLPDTDQGSSASKRPRLDDVTEAEDSMSVDEYDDFDSGSDQEEPDSASDADRERGVTGGSYVQTVTGDVATYTIKNYAYGGDVAAGIIGDPYIAQ